MTRENKIAGRRVKGGQEVSLPRLSAANLQSRWSAAGFSEGVIRNCLSVGLVKALTTNTTGGAL